MKHYAVVKSGYVINVIIGGDDDAPVVQQPHDALVADPDGVVAIGDWYQADEELFYRPLGVPPDREAE